MNGSGFLSEVKLFPFAVLTRETFFQISFDNWKKFLFSAKFFVSGLRLVNQGACISIKSN
jgi:hypothetical protein